MLSLSRVNYYYKTCCIFSLDAYFRTSQHINEIELCSTEDKSLLYTVKFFSSFKHFSFNIGLAIDIHPNIRATLDDVYVIYFEMK